MFEKRMFAVLLLCSSTIISFNAQALFMATAKCDYIVIGGIDQTSATCDYSRLGYWDTRASADLATGQMRSYTFLSGEAVPTIDAAAYLEDELTTIGLAPGESDFIEVNLNVTGSISGNPRDDYQFAWIDLNTGILGGANEAYASVQLFYDGTTVTTNTDGSFGNFEITINSLTAGNIDITLSTLVLVSSIDPTYSVISYIGTTPWPETATSTATADFGSTASLSLKLPEGLSYTSDSGVFLSAIPVPPAVYLFGSGLIGLIGMVRRKKS